LGHLIPGTIPVGQFPVLGIPSIGLGLKFPMPVPPAAPWPIGRNPTLGLSACYVSPLLAAQRSNNSKLIDGVQNFTSLIASNLGPRVKLVNDTVWLGHDFIVFYRDLKDPEVSQQERLVSLGELGSSMCGVLAGVLHTPWLDEAATSLHFAASFGEHLHTGKITLSQSELMELSSTPHAEEYSKVMAIAELVLPSG
jgi:hypothetical protein